MPDRLVASLKVYEGDDGKLRFEGLVPFVRALQRLTARLHAARRAGLHAWLIEHEPPS